MYMERVSVTDRAKVIIDQLREWHGDLIFHQSGGCRDGSAPMCLAKGDLLIGSRDACLGKIHGCDFYMASDQFEFYKNMHITVDVSEGRGFSLSFYWKFRLVYVLWKSQGCLRMMNWSM